MKTILPFIFVALLIVSCNSKKKEISEQESIQKEIVEIEKELYSHEELDKEIAKDISSKYVYYADKFPTDSLSPEYLFKAAEIAMNLNEPGNAIKYLGRIENDYKNYPRYAGCIFLTAYVYENQLRNFTKAREYYERFLEDYPDHVMAKDAKAALNFLGLDDQQIVDLFNEMNKNKPN